jgi:uncharacterized protein (DUF433 family)
MQQLITISPFIQSGTPVFYNTRVPVKNLFDYLKGGHTLEEFLDDFPSVTKDQAIEGLEEARELLAQAAPEPNADDEFRRPGDGPCIAGLLGGEALRLGFLARRVG